MKKRVCVIGGGAAGMMAAGTAILHGADVTIFEHMKMLGKKLAITGKGRCNVTNACDTRDFITNITKNARFMFSTLNSFGPYDVMSFFEDAGVPLKVERGNRVFPVSDKAIDIVNALRHYSENALVINEKVKRIFLNDNGSFTVHAASEYIFDSVILATGGRSYPLTGSDGSGYRLATRLGHTATALSPSLVPINSTDPLCHEMQGLSLKNVGIKIIDENRNTVYSDFGEMMFTHFGVTGPVILSASAHVRNYDISSLTLSIDLKPALDEDTLDKRLLSEFEKNSNKDVINVMPSLLPSKMIEPFLAKAGVDERRKVNSITKQERMALLSTLKSFDIQLDSFRPIEEAIITSGGIDVKEIDPKTMESKLVNGLYFAGEVIDVDAYTGGFNLQIAFSTGYSAGMHAAEIY